jgi:hypothetical protein
MSRHIASGISNRIARGLEEGFCGAPALAVGRVNAGRSPDPRRCWHSAVAMGVRDACTSGALRSFASQRRQGCRCAARCARPCRATLDCAASLRWMALRVAQTRNLPDSRHFLLGEALASVPREPPPDRATSPPRRRRPSPQRPSHQPTGTAGDPFSRSAEGPLVGDVGPARTCRERPSRATIEPCPAAAGVRVVWQSRSGGSSQLLRCR